MVLGEQRLLGSWREHSGFAFRRCQRGHTLNAAGMQLFGNCVSNLERLPMQTLKELYFTLTGNITAPCVDAVSVAAVLGGVHRNTVRGWYAPLNANEWSAASTPGHSHIKLAVGKSGAESAVGNPETDLTALPDTLPVVVGVAETSSESDCGLDQRFGQGSIKRPDVGGRSSHIATTKLGSAWTSLAVAVF